MSEARATGREPAPSPGRWRARLLVLVAALACVVAAFSPRDLWAPDEPRYGQVAREMLADGEWLVPHVNQTPYAEKPPLYFWLSAGLSAPFGRVTPVTARLAAALLAALAVWLTARLARRFFGDHDLAATAAALFASTALVLWNAPRAGLDLPLTCFILASVDRATAWWDGAGLHAAVLAGVAWAGAILVKGPVGLILPPLVCAGAFLFARRARRLGDPGWWIAPLVMAGLLLAWLLPAMQSGGEAYADRLVGQVADRTTGVEVSHRRPVAYYVLRVGPLALPWSLHLLAGVVVLFTWRRRPRAHAYGFGAAAAGGLGLLVVLTLVATKREVYMLPGFPFGAMLAAYAIHHGVAPGVQSLGRWLVLPCLVGIAFTAIAAPWVVPLAADRGWIEDIAFGDSLTAVASVVGGCGLLLAAFLVWRVRARPVAFAQMAAAFILVAGAFLHVIVVPVLDPMKSFGRAATAAEAASGGGPVLHAGFGQGPNLLWSLPRARVIEVRDASALLPVGRCALVAEVRWWAHVEAEAERDARLDALVQRARVTWTGPVGHRHMVVVALPPAEDP